MDLLRVHEHTTAMEQPIAVPVEIPVLVTLESINKGRMVVEIEIIF